MQVGSPGKEALTIVHLSDACNRQIADGSQLRGQSL